MSQRVCGLSGHCHLWSFLTCHSDPGSASRFSKQRAAVLLDWLDWRVGLKVETVETLRVLFITTDMKYVVYWYNISIIAWEKGCNFNHQLICRLISWFIVLPTVQNPRWHSVYYHWRLGKLVNLWHFLLIKWTEWSIYQSVNLHVVAD